MDKVSTFQRFNVFKVHAGNVRSMKEDVQKSMTAALALILLGIIVLLTGERSLIVLIPAAVLVWYATAPKLRRSRN